MEAVFYKQRWEGDFEEEVMDGGGDWSELISEGNGICGWWFGKGMVAFGDVHVHSSARLCTVAHHCREQEMENGEEEFGTRSGTWISCDPPMDLLGFRVITQGFRRLVKRDLARWCGKENRVVSPWFSKVGNTREKRFLRSKNLIKSSFIKLNK